MLGNSIGVRLNVRTYVVAKPWKKVSALRTHVRASGSFHDVMCINCLFGSGVVRVRECGSSVHECGSSGVRENPTSVASDAASNQSGRDM